MASRLAWRAIHHCVAHPLMALSELVNVFHDWTAAKAFPDDEPVSKPPGGEQ